MIDKAKGKRACDSCHRRKLKCIGEITAACKNCTSSGLECTYNVIPKKRGPQRERTNILDEIRETQRNAQLAAGFPTDPGFDSQSLSSAFARTTGLMPPALVESCIEYFFAHVYPLEPVLHRQRAQEAAVGMDRSTETYCMVVALCACVMIQANHKPPVSVLPRPEMAHMSNVSIGRILLEESVRVRQGYDHRENPTYFSVLTSWFYSACYLGLARENTAWIYLRDAITQAQLLGMHDEKTYQHGPLDICSKQVLYCLLFIAERTYALHKHRPISLHPTVHTPSLDETSPDRPIAVGLELMVNMFKIVDDTFINLWNRVHNTHASAAWMVQVQTQLIEAVPAYFRCLEVLEVQIRITQQWLRLQAWQLSACQGLVGSVSNDTPLAFTLKYPIMIARDLLTIWHQFSQQAMDVHGIRLTEKLFDIACCLIDVVACTSLPPGASVLGPRDYVCGFLTFVSVLPGGQTRYLPLLLAKLSKVLPSFPLPRALNLAQTVPAGTLDFNAPGSGTTFYNVADDSSGNPNVNSLSCPSDALIYPLAQNGAGLPLNATQHFMVDVPTTQIEGMSMYPASHSTAHSHSSSPAAGSTSRTPDPCETPMSQRSLPIVGQPSMSLPTSHEEIQNHNIDADTTAYDPLFYIQ